MTSPEGSGLIARATFFAEGNYGAWDDDWVMKLVGELASALSAYEGRLEELRAAGRQVLRGLHARIDAAVEAKEPVPVFVGIARLSGALTALEQSGEGLGSSVASRAGEGLRPFASDSQEILGKEDQ